MCIRDRLKRSPKTLANPNPWKSPNVKTMTQVCCFTTGQMLFAAARKTDRAMIDSTTLDERETTPNAARLKVIEWARVKQVTIFTTFHSAERKLLTDVH